MSGLPQQMLAAMLHGLNDAVVTIDHDGHIKGFNREACELLGIKESDALGKPVAKLLGLSDGDALLPPWVGGATAGDLAVKHKDGSTVKLQATSSRASDGVTVIVLRAPGKPKAGARSSGNGKANAGSTGDVAELPPRLRETLSALLEGMSEKQIAGKLSLSQHTVHDYVKALYKRFSVQSRAELLALFVAESHKR